MSRQLPLWVEALNGRPRWNAIYEGYGSAVDWPTARYFRELHAAYPEAKFILTHRTPQTWAESFSATIYTLLNAPDAPPAMHDWLECAGALIKQSGFPRGLDIESLQRAFVDHNDAVKAAIPAAQLLIYQVSEGWGPLCEFLEVPVPQEPLPHANDTDTFRVRVVDGALVALDAWRAEQTEAAAS